MRATVIEKTNAIFLSYSSEDTEAARQICDSLREAGLEVWFDPEYTAHFIDGLRQAGLELDE